MRSSVWFTCLLVGLLRPGMALNDAIYTSWLEDSTYERQLTLAEGKTVIHWTIDDVNDQIHLAMAVEASGWAAFGISENGGMRGADMVIFEAEEERLIDAHVLDELFPIPDACQSWTLKNSITDDGIIIFEATRLLDTGDSQDRAIIDDRSMLVQANRIIVAWGDTPQSSYHGPNRARGSVRFYGDDQGDEWSNFRDLMNDEAEGSLLMVADNFPIPTRETTYMDFCFLYEDLLALGMPPDVELHTIGVEPIVDERTVPYIHHFVVQANADPTECGGFEVAFAWAPGDLPVGMPPNVGGPLGEGGFKSFSVQIHYNNPDQVPDLFDSSGIRMHWTTQKREFDLGVMQVGDPLIELYGQQVGDGLTSHDFVCKPSCTSLVMSEPITVLRETLHMHKSGKRMFNSQIRGDEVVRTATADYFDYDQQGSLNVVQAAFTIEPGDSFQTKCYYDSQDEIFGLASQDEMCIAFLYYYPRQLAFGRIPLTCGAGLSFGAFTQCEAEYTETDLSSPVELERSFGPAPLTCPQIPTPAPATAAGSIPVVTPAPVPTMTLTSKAPVNTPVSATTPPISGTFIKSLVSSVLLSSILFMALWA